MDGMSINVENSLHHTRVFLNSSQVRKTFIYLYNYKGQKTVTTRFDNFQIIPQYYYAGVIVSAQA